MAPSDFEVSSPIEDRENGPIADLPPSSPLGPPSRNSTKPKKPPPVTPRRFQKFFTPRSSSGRSHSTGRSGRQLQDITRHAVNRKANSTHHSGKRGIPFGGEHISLSSDVVTPHTGSGRKRKAVNFSDNIESSPLQPSPTKRTRFHCPPLPDFKILVDKQALNDLDQDDEEDEVLPVPIRRLKGCGTNSRILQRSLGGFNCLQRGRRVDHCSSWQDQTSEFFTSPEDVCALPPGTLPFCTASCNTNSLVAVGDEDGWVRILETGQDQRQSFTKEYISFRPHNNAVMDLAFSSDDRLLATASGDQTAHVIDVSTQRSVYILAQHSSSVKQVSFQPGHDSVLASSSRDGTVQLWDLRCKGAVATIARGVADAGVRLGTTVNTIMAGHTDLNSPRDASKTDNQTTRRLEASITALAFMPVGRENLLLTASDASSSIKLWDIRSRYSRRSAALPLSTSQIPESHSKHRHFGINSLVLNTDGARLYALSRDSTIYAYSTNHLILGAAPELSPSSFSRHRHLATGREGLGPMYGFRHAKFHATTFYVKAALRKATADKPEMLVVGSSDGVPVLFPTDETVLRRGNNHHYHYSNDRNDDNLYNSFRSPAGPETPLSGLTNNSTRWFSRMEDTIPIFTQGTALVRGHAREVTSVTWTCEGNLISASDDFTVRRWREGPEARELRQSGEVEGRRWASGWAETNRIEDDED